MDGWLGKTNPRSMTEMPPKPRPARAGRAARMALRHAGHRDVDPAASGQAGGAYRPLSDADCTRIVETAFRILEDIGMGEVPDALRDAAVARGAIWGDDARLRFPHAVVTRAIDAAAKGFTLYGRAPGRDLRIGGDAVHFGTGGAAVRTQDLETGLYREATLRDLYDFTRLADGLDRISWFTRCVVATDVPDIFELDLNTAFALLKGTTKPVGTSITLAEHVDPIVDMFDIALGGPERFRDRPFCKAHISPVISPLRYGEDAVAVARACIRRGMPINAIIAAQSGATAPAPPAGMLAQSTAETLAALLMVDAFAPGFPMIFSNWPFVIDLRSGAFAGGGGEIALMNAAAAQIARQLGLPSGVAAAMSDAKALDAQMGSEKALSTLATGLAGANLVYESAGMMASLLGASFAAFVADNDALGHVNRILRGVEVTDDTLSFDDIARTVTGEGHFLGADTTRAAMERDYYYPLLADRNTPDGWAESGAEDLDTRARARARAMLAAPDPEYLSKDAEAAIRARYPILL